MHSGGPTVTWRRCKSRLTDAVSTSQVKLNKQTSAGTPASVQQTVCSTSWVPASCHQRLAGMGNPAIVDELVHTVDQGRRDTSKVVDRRVDPQHGLRSTRQRLDTTLSRLLSGMRNDLPTSVTTTASNIFTHHQWSANTQCVTGPHKHSFSLHKVRWRHRQQLSLGWSFSLHKVRWRHRQQLSLGRSFSLSQGKAGLL